MVSIRGAPAVNKASATAPLLEEDAPSEARVHEALDVKGSRRRLDDVLTVSGNALRGVPLTSMLRGRAAVLADGGAAARDDPAGCYALSRPVESLSHFCSHSWSAPQYAKWLALTFHFNSSAAVGLVFLLYAVAFHVELFYFEWMPSGTMTLASTFVQVQYCPLCSLLACIVLPAALFTAHRVSPSARRARLFLDVSCINQSDHEQKMAGIAALGAILDRSETMLVLSDDTYWSRSWCLFELAAFAHRAGLERCVVVPMHLAMLDASMLAYGVLYNLLPLTTTCSSCPPHS